MPPRATPDFAPTTQLLPTGAGASTRDIQQADSRRTGARGRAAAARQSTAPQRLAHARPARQSTWTIALHWASALAVVVAVISALWWDATDNSRLRDVLMATHRQAGLLALLGLGLRLLVRWRVGLADHAVQMSALMHRAALAAHLALYGLLLAVPLLGWATTSAHATPLRLFGLLPLPAIAADDPDLADRLSDWHAWAAWSLVALVVLHVAAALWHHWVRCDAVLRAMLPWTTGHQR